MSIIRLLLDYGAYALARDANGDTCIDIIARSAEPLQPYFHPLRIGKYITLKGLAANAVRRNNIAHNGVIPQDLLYFTELH